MIGPNENGEMNNRANIGAVGVNDEVTMLTIWAYKLFVYLFRFA